MYVCVCTLVVPTKAASWAVRGREGQAAWGAEETPGYWGQWLWRHGWNVGLPRYAICVNMTFMGPAEHACYLKHVSPLISTRVLLLQSFLYVPMKAGNTQIDFCCGFCWILPLEKLLSKHSKVPSVQDEATSQEDVDLASPSPAPPDPGTVAELRKQIEELTSQNTELVLKVQVVMQSTH